MNEERMTIKERIIWAVLLLIAIATTWFWFTTAIPAAWQDHNMMEITSLRQISIITYFWAGHLFMLMIARIFVSLIKERVNDERLAEVTVTLLLVGNIFGILGGLIVGFIGSIFTKEVNFLYEMIIYLLVGASTIGTIAGIILGVIVELKDEFQINLSIFRKKEDQIES